MPDEIRQFCLGQRLDDSSRESEATAAVLFTDGPKQWTKGGWIEETINGREYLTKPFQLIDQPFGAALLLISIRADSQSTCSISDNCADIVSIAYLRADGQQFRLTERWNEVVRIEPPNSNFLTISHNANSSFENTELIVVEGNLPHRETVIALTPNGPVNRGIMEPSG